MNPSIVDNIKKGKKKENNHKHTFNRNWQTLNYSEISLFYWAFYVCACVNRRMGTGVYSNESIIKHYV